MRTLGWRESVLGALAASLLVALVVCAGIGTAPPHQDRGGSAVSEPYAGRAVATLPASNPAYRNRDASGRALRDRAEPKKKSPALAVAEPPPRPASANSRGRRQATGQVRGFDLLRRQRARAPPILMLAIV
jgi:hypothetical protein